MALDRLDGTYGMLFLFREHPDMIIGARNGSRLWSSESDRKRCFWLPMPRLLPAIPTMPYLLKTVRWWS